MVLDGTKIGFVRFRRTWQSDGPYPVNEQTILTFLEALRVKSLNRDLGAGSPIAKTLVRVLYETLNRNKGHNKKVGVLFDDWKRVFGQVCGYSPEKIKGLEKAYGLSGNEIDYEKLLFAVHTYYALVMKLLAAEVAVSSGDYLQSYLKKFEDAYYRGVKSGFSGDEFEERVKKEVLRSGAKLNKKEINVLVGLFHKLRELEEEGKNRIWTRILKNSFAPLLHGK